MSNARKLVRIFNCFRCTVCSKCTFAFETVVPIEIGCYADSECPPNQACRNRKCVNPCRESNPCSSLAICSVSQHRPQCSCPQGMTGDPYLECRPSKRRSYSSICSFDFIALLKFQLNKVNAHMMTCALIAKPVLIKTVMIRVDILTTLVGRMLNARQPLTDQFAGVELVGQEILMNNATNVITAGNVFKI